MFKTRQRSFKKRTKTDQYWKNGRTKKIRIKNSLCHFSQKEREKIKKEIEKLDDYLSDSKYSKFVSIIKDGELKAISDNYLMFMFEKELIAESFNMELVEIENFIENALEKNDYNKNKEKYKYIDEKNLFNEIYNLDITSENLKSNSIDEMFNDIIEYE